MFRYLLWASSSSLCSSLWVVEALAGLMWGDEDEDGASAPSPGSGRETRQL